MKKRKIHVAPPATATEILRTLKISKKDIAVAKKAVEQALGKSS